MKPPIDMRRLVEAFDDRGSLEHRCKHCGQEYGDHSALRALCPNVHAPGTWLRTTFECAEPQIGADSPLKKDDQQ